MESLLKQECERLLVGTTHSPIAELSYLRLLTWKVSNDTILHPVTTINGAEPHLHVALPFDKLRSGLHAILEESEQVLECDLMFNLHAAPRIKTEHLVHNPSKLASSFCFLDDKCNEF